MNTHITNTQTRKLQRGILWIVLVLFTFFWVAPFIFLVFTSFKSPGELFSRSVFAPPTSLRWSNYIGAWKTGNIGRVMWNSLLVTIKVPIGILFSSMAAFFFARFRFRFQKLLFLFMIGGTMIAPQVLLAPLFRLLLKLGLINSLFGVMMVYIGFGVPYGIFILTGFFKTIPVELEEAARIDGASHFNIYWNVILPLAKPALAAIFIIDFVGTWNEFGMALVILQKQKVWTVPLAFQSYISAYQNDYGQLTAAITMTILPVLLVYALFQRHFVSGIARGALKG